jgi:hypothetical protein
MKPREDPKKTTFQSLSGKEIKNKLIFGGEINYEDTKFADFDFLMREK